MHMEQATFERIKKFFSPTHIAVVGASTKNHWFANMVRYAHQAGLAGRIYPVNPKASEVCGIRAYPSIPSLPEGTIDFAVIMVKSTLVLQSLQELLRKGVKDVLLISSGYAEMGGEGVSHQEELTRFCREHDIRLMGPNCLGFMNLSERVSVFTGGSVEGELLPGSIALLGQSGASSEMIATKLLKRSLGISLYAATGNEAMITTEDCMEYLVHDNRTRVITAFMEGFRDISRMKGIAVAAAQKGRFPLSSSRSADRKKACRPPAPIQAPWQATMPQWRDSSGSMASSVSTRSKSSWKQRPSSPAAASLRAQV